MYQRGRIQPFLVNVPKDGHVTPTDFSARINLSFSLAVHRDRIRSIAFPSTMTVVRNHDEHDYMRMTNLRKLVFSPNLKAIESGAFAGCFLLEELVIPESVTDIGRGAFAGAGKALKVVIVKGWRRHPAFSRRYGNIFTSASLRAGIASEVEVKVEVVDAPNSFVRMLGGVCKGYSKYKGLPAEIRGRSHQYPFLDAAFHAAFTAQTNEYVMAVLLVGERLEAAAHAALDSNDATTAAGPPAAGAGDDSAGPPAAGADDGEEPMYLPVEMWLHILSFVPCT